MHALPDCLLHLLSESNGNEGEAPYVDNEAGAQSAYEAQEESN